MRRILWMAAVAVLVLAMAEPAMAFTFTFGGLARTRFYDHTGIGFDRNTTENPGNNIKGADLLFRARFDASDDNGNVLSVLRLRIGKIVFGGGGGTENPVQFAAPAGPNTQQNNIALASATFTAPATLTTTQTITGVGDRLGPSAGGGLGTRGTNIETEWAYLDFALPFNIPLRIRSGLQPWYTPKGLITDDNVAGVRMYGTVAPVTYELDWFRLDSGLNQGSSAWISSAIGVSGRYRVDTGDNNYDVYGARVDFAIAPPWNTGIYAYFGDNRINCAGTVATTNFQSSTAPTITPANTAPCPTPARERGNYYLGWTNTGKIGIVTWDFDFVYGNAVGGSTGNFVAGTINTSTNGNNNLQPIRVSGFVIDTGIHFPIGPVRLHFGGSYATGDDQSGLSPAYPGGYSPSWKGPLGATEFIGDGGSSGFDVLTSTQSTPTNLWTIGAVGEYNPVKALTLKMVLAFAGFSNKKGNCGYDANGTLGSNSFGCYGPIYYGKGFTPTGPTLTQSNGPGTNDGVPNGSSSTSFAQGTGGLAGSSTLGTEIDLIMYWNVWTNFNINAMMGWFVPTKGDLAGKYMLNFVYSF